MNNSFKGNIKELTKACYRIRETLTDSDPTGTQPELTAIKKELEILYRHLCAMAVATISGMLNVSLSYEQFRLENLNDTAHDIVVESFFSVSNDGKTFTIFNLLSKLFVQNENPSDLDIFRFLKKSVQRGVSGYSKKVLGERNPLFISTARKLDYYISNTERYKKKNGLVYDSYEKDERSGSSPTADDLIRLTSGRALPTNVAQATDLFFDTLKSAQLFRCAVEISELRNAVYRLLEHRLIDNESIKFLGQSIGPGNTLISEILHSARKEALIEVRNVYSQIDGYSPAELEAFICAGDDYLYDYSISASPKPLSRYLSIHLEGCTTKIYNELYKGRFQHFIKKLFSIWQKKLHANPMVLSHIRGEESELGKR